MSLKITLSNLGNPNQTSIIAAGETFKGAVVATIYTHPNGRVELKCMAPIGQCEGMVEATADNIGAMVRDRIRVLEAEDAARLAERAAKRQAWDTVVSMLGVSPEN